MNANGAVGDHDGKGGYNVGVFVRSGMIMPRFAANLAEAADRAAEQHRVLALEPINTRVDMPGYLLDSLAGATGNGLA